MGIRGHAARQVIVDRDQVCASGQRIQMQRQVATRVSIALRISAILPECRTTHNHLHIVMAQPMVLLASRTAARLQASARQGFFDRQGKF
jgi:hypothetical protein